MRWTRSGVTAFSKLNFCDWCCLAYLFAPILYGLFLLLFFIVSKPLSSKSKAAAGKKSTASTLKTAAKIIVRYFVQIAIIGEFAVAWPSLNLFMFQWPDFLRFHRC